jgi:hypothetical protein
MKQYIFEVSKSFQDLISIYGMDGISDLDVGEEAALHNIWYRRLEAWFFDPDLNQLEIFVED